MRRRLFKRYRSKGRIWTQARKEHWYIMDLLEQLFTERKILVRPMW